MCPKTVIPIVSWWIKVGKIYLPDPALHDDEEHISRSLPQSFESDFWGSLCVRGITILHDILSGGERNEDSAHRTCLRSLFPRLINIDLDQIPAEHIFRSSGGVVNRILRESTNGIQELGISLPGPVESDIPDQFLAGINPFAQMYTQSLKCLSVDIDTTYSNDNRIPLIPTMTELLPQFAVLSSLEVFMSPLRTTHAELLAFGEAIKGCKTLRALDLGGSCLENETWEDLLNQWKLSESLNGLHQIEIWDMHYGCGPNGTLLFNFEYRAKSKSAIVDWLHGRTSQFPLESFAEDTDSDW